MICCKSVLCFVVVATLSLYSTGDDLRAQASATTFGSGCGTPAFELDPANAPVIGRPLILWVRNFQPNGLVVVNYGVRQVSQPLDGLGLPGCTQYTPAVLVDEVGAFTDPFYRSTFIPNSQALVGADIYAQAIAPEPNANAPGVVLSNGVHLRIGTH